MEETSSYERELPEGVLARYDCSEVRNAAAVLRASSPGELADLVEVLEGFTLAPADLTSPGGNKSDVAARLDLAFRRRGWREARHDTTVVSRLQIQPWAEAGEHEVVAETVEIPAEGYLIDAVKGRVALDVEWNAKDGNLDRDLASYRGLYEAGVIDAAVIVTRTQRDLRRLAVELGAPTKFSTTTTTNLEKLRNRLARGDTGGCPVLAVAVTARTMAGGVPEPPAGPAPQGNLFDQAP